MTEIPAPAAARAAAPPGPGFPWVHARPGTVQPMSCGPPVIPLFTGGVLRRGPGTRSAWNT
ncbi:hypothetical protein SUDANB176_07024 [Streptomyces sp. enrichment culture]